MTKETRIQLEQWLRNFPATQVFKLNILDLPDTDGAVMIRPATTSDGAVTTMSNDDLNANKAFPNLFLLGESS